jgi:cell division septum initiation protein DivIVA
MIISTEKLSGVKGAIDALIEQGETLFSDVGDTVTDRERLLQEAEAMRQHISELQHQKEALQARVDQLEAMADSVRASMESVALPHVAHTDGNGAATPLRRHRVVDTPAGSRLLAEREQPTAR